MRVSGPRICVDLANSSRMTCLHRQRLEASSPRALSCIYMCIFTVYITVYTRSCISIYVYTYTKCKYYVLLIIVIVMYVYVTATRISNRSLLVPARECWPECEVSTHAVEWYEFCEGPECTRLALLDAPTLEVVVDEPSLKESEEDQIDDKTRAEPVASEERLERSKSFWEVSKLWARGHAPCDRTRAHQRQQWTQPTPLTDQSLRGFEVVSVNFRLGFGRTHDEVWE